MNELRNSKSDDQLEELLLLTEQMQEELDQKDRTIRELKVQLDESLTLNEKLNSENKTENIQALKNDLRKTKELLQSEKEKTHTVQAMIEECRDKQRQAEQERDYALSHQKKVEIPVEKPVLYQKCGNCKQTAYLKAKEKYDMQKILSCKSPKEAAMMSGSVSVVLLIPRYLMIMGFALLAIYFFKEDGGDRKSTRLNSSHCQQSRMPSSA